MTELISIVKHTDGKVYDKIKAFGCSGCVAVGNANRDLCQSLPNCVGAIFVPHVPKDRDTNENSVAAISRNAVVASHDSLAHRVVEHIKLNGPATRQELAKLFDKPASSLCGPIKALLKAGLLVEGERIRNPETQSWNWKLEVK